MTVSKNTFLFKVCPRILATEIKNFFRTSNIFVKLQYKLITTDLYKSSKLCSLLSIVFYMLGVGPTLDVRF